MKISSINPLFLKISSNKVINLVVVQKWYFRIMSRFVVYYHILPWIGIQILFGSALSAPIFLNQVPLCANTLCLYYRIQLCITRIMFINADLYFTVIYRKTIVLWFIRLLFKKNNTNNTFLKHKRVNYDLYWSKLLFNL